MAVAYQLHHVHYAYQDKLALCLDELSIAAHKKTTLIGANGSGKSTLLYLLAYVYRPQQGSIQLFNQPLDSKQSSHIALLPQNPYLLRGSVRDNLQLSLRFHAIKDPQKTRIQHTLATLHISHLIDKPTHALSGGERQKVALARAIISQPKILLMDEPFSYLDQQSEHSLEQFMHQYVEQQGNTLIFSTHNRLQGIAVADNTISLVEGRSVQTVLINLFKGQVKQAIFDTGKIKIQLADIKPHYQHISISPTDIVLSKMPLHSSMRNQYQGKVTSISEEQGQIRVSLLAGELFQVIITPDAFQELNISLGLLLWIQFKSNTCLAF